MSRRKITAEQYRSMRGKNKYGAKKAEADGIVFDSIHERNLYLALKRGGFEIELQKKFELLPPLRYLPDESMTRRRTCRIDFYLPAYNVLADAKGFQPQASSLRMTLLKHALAGTTDPPILCMVKPKEIDRFCLALRTPDYAENLKFCRI